MSSSIHGPTKTSLSCSSRADRIASLTGPEIPRRSFTTSSHVPQSPALDWRGSLELRHGPAEQGAPTARAPHWEGAPCSVPCERGGIGVQRGSILMFKEKRSIFCPSERKQHSISPWILETHTRYPQKDVQSAKRAGKKLGLS